MELMLEGKVTHKNYKWDLQQELQQEQTTGLNNNLAGDKRKNGSMYKVGNHRCRA